MHRIFTRSLGRPAQLHQQRAPQRENIEALVVPVPTRLVELHVKLPEQLGEKGLGGEMGKVSRNALPRAVAERVESVAVVALELGWSGVEPALGPIRVGVVEVGGRSRGGELVDADDGASLDEFAALEGFG